MDSRHRTPENKLLEALALHDEATKAFDAKQFEVAVGLYETLDRLGQLTPEERERLKTARRLLQHQGEELDEDGTRFLHQRDREDDEDRRRARRQFRFGK